MTPLERQTYQLQYQADLAERHKLMKMRRRGLAANPTDILQKAVEEQVRVIQPRIQRPIEQLAHQQNQLDEKIGNLIEEAKNIDCHMAVRNQVPLLENQITEKQRIQSDLDQTMTTLISKLEQRRHEKILLISKITKLTHALKVSEKLPYDNEELVAWGQRGCDVISSSHKS